MDTCFDCGGKLKIVAKPGRMVWDNDELYEVPTEVKISACLDCGQPLKDAFMKNKLQNSIAAQKKTKPNVRLLHLRWIDKLLFEMFKRPRMFGNKCAVLCQTLLLLESREMIISRGEQSKHKEIHEAWIKFKSKKWDPSALAYPKGISLENDLAPALREFCDIWINT